MYREHISLGYCYDHLDLIGCEERLLGDDSIDCLDPHICLARLIDRTLYMYLCYDPIFELIPIGDLYDLSDP